MKKKEGSRWFSEEVIPSLVAHHVHGSYACSLLSASLSYFQTTKSNTRVLNNQQCKSISRTCHGWIIWVLYFEISFMHGRDLAGYTECHVESDTQFEWTHRLPSDVNVSDKSHWHANLSYFAIHLARTYGAHSHSPMPWRMTTTSIHLARTCGVLMSPFTFPATPSLFPGTAARTALGSKAHLWSLQNSKS